MPFAFLLALVAITSATLLTYLYDPDALFLSRLCAGACTGFAALGLVGFVIASLIGLTPVSLALTGLLVAAPLVLLARREWRERINVDIVESARVVRAALTRPGRGGATGALIFYLLVALLFWFTFDRAMYQNPGGVFTGVDNNIGDLPFHLSIITGFAHGANFPPQHTEFAGVRLTYPFIIDFVAAMFVRAGASLQGALFWQNFVLALSLTGLLHRWALKLTGDTTAALITPALVLLSGGFGWTELFADTSRSGHGVFELLTALPHDYTIMGHIGYRWGNAMTTLLIPQRGLLLGIPLALVVWTLWWQSLEMAESKSKSKKAKGKSEDEGKLSEVKKRKERAGKKRKQASEGASASVKLKTNEPLINRPTPLMSDSSFTFYLLPFAFPQMFAAGIIAGMLPLVHAHSFVVMMTMGGCLSLLFADWRGTVGDASSSEGFAWMKLFESFRPWLVFFIAALVIAVPQMLWATHSSAVRASQFFGWEFGWNHGTSNVFWFWLKNTGLFIPLLVAALLWRGSGRVVPQRLLYFYLPFALCFIVPNLVKMSPWVWDNIKVIFYWWIASAPLVALLLARLWRSGAAWRAASVAMLIVLTLSGALDVWRVASSASERRVFEADGVALSEIIKRETAPRSLILHAPTYNDPSYLSGRRTFLGYAGHLWSHGIDDTERVAELKRIYTGAPDASSLLKREGIEYVVVGPLERDELAKTGQQINEAFFKNYTKVGEAGAYRLYKTTTTP